MQGMSGENCPFEFSFDPETFKVGDTVSYRVATLDDWPFVGVLVEVHDDYVVLTSDPAGKENKMRATRESRPVVADIDAT
jgi:hypothetical protein